MEGWVAGWRQRKGGGEGEEGKLGAYLSEQPCKGLPESVLCSAIDREVEVVGEAQLRGQAGVVKAGEMTAEGAD